MTPSSASRAVSLSVLLALGGPAAAIPEGPEPDTPEWFQREAANYQRATGTATEHADPAFQARLQQQGTANELAYALRAIEDSSWLDPRAGNANLLPLCASWALPCAGDPFRYPEAPGPDGAAFYETEAEVVPVVFYDRGCARISGRVWAPRGGGDGLPAVVIQTGSVQAPEPLYWWMAQSLVRSGYVAMTFDVRGQGRSDFQTPGGGQGGNFDSSVFFDGMVDAIDFFRSTPGRPYPRNLECAGTYPTTVTPHNPHHARLDAERLGIAGHSLGASGVSAVQGYAGSAFAFPDGLGGNPVRVVVAWDSLNPDENPRVPAMGQTSEYGLTPAIKTSAPDPESHKDGYAAWAAAGQPVYQLTIQGSTHYEWSLIPAVPFASFPASSWCPDPASGRCAGGWGNPVAEHYSLAWFDRWLKQPGGSGHDTADARLLDDAAWRERHSFYFRSARKFPDRAGRLQACEDIRAGCPVAATPGLGRASGGAPGGRGLVLMLVAAAVGRRLRSRGRSPCPTA